MKIYNASNKLPPLKKGINQRIDKEKLSILAEKVRKILIKEGRIKPDDDENISSPGNSLCY